MIWPKILIIAKSIKSNLAQAQLSDFIKAKKLDFAKVNFSKTDFLILGAKKAFIHQLKVFTKALIPRYFDLRRHI